VKKKSAKLKVRHLLVVKHSNAVVAAESAAVVAMVASAQRFPFYVNVHDSRKRPLTFYPVIELCETLNAIAKHHTLPARFEVARHSVKYPFLCRELTLQDLME
jgi:hypothetical protein